MVVDKLSGARVNAYSASKNVEMDAFRPGVRALSQLPGRVMDEAEYNEHAKLFKTVGPDMVTHAGSPEQRRQYAALQGRKSSYWSDFVNTIWAMQDAMCPDSDRPPIILFGNGKFPTGRGSTAGNYTWLKTYLARFFLIILVDEYNTSQRCPKCLGQLEFHGKGVRIKACGSCRPTCRRLQQVQHPNWGYLCDEFL